MSGDWPRNQSREALIPSRSAVDPWFSRLLPLALAAFASTCAQDEEKELDRNWLARDLERIEQLRGALGASELTVEDIQRDLESPDVREDRDIGFGARRVCLAAYGGYTTVWVRILAEARIGEGESRVARLTVTQSGFADSWKLVAARLRAAWARPVRDDARSIEFEHEDSPLILALAKQTEAALGGREEVEVAVEHARAFELLTAPCEDVIVGQSYSIDGGPPPGAVEIRGMVDAGRFDLVRAVLRGFNPEGRAYAAHALLARGELDPADEAAIAKLRALPVELTISHGCLVSRVGFDRAIATLDE